MDFETEHNNMLARISIIEEKEKYYNNKLSDDEKILADQVSSTINQRLYALKNELSNL